MALVSLQEIVLGFGGPPLLEGATFAIERGERVCLVGRNGTGKSTLLRLLVGEVRPDAGQVIVQSGVKLALLTQEVPLDLPGRVVDVVAGAFGDQARLLDAYHEVNAQLALGQSPALMARHDALQHELDASGAWQSHLRVDELVARLQLPPHQPYVQLSGGLKRRTLLARALVAAPDLLILDEPTNHLDIEAIAWLEAFLLELRPTLLFVTHDRVLLQALATRIVDLDRGRLTSWPGRYSAFLEKKQAALDIEEAAEQRADRKLAIEETWLRQGVKARRTRNEGRVRALEELRRQRAARRGKVGTAVMQVQEAERTGQVVLEAQGLTFSHGDRPLIRDCSTIILCGDWVGIMGQNGTGKTTLIKLLLGELTPQLGTVKRGSNLEVVYLDQQRAQLDDEATVADSVANGSDYVTLNGQRRHILGYLQDFLFAPQRARSLVKVLSGGERNRLLLAKLFTKPSNVLVLDEPTNDLDVETLDLLEELLLQYQGTVLLVSHDRAFLNNVVTSTLVLEGDGHVGDYAGGYDDWLTQRPKPAEPAPKAKAAPQEPPRPKARKRSFKEQRELDELPARIAALETEHKALVARMADPTFYKQSGNAVAAAQQRLHAVDDELSALFARWEELETLPS